ncbi:MAG: hypothetical protein PF442_02205 [Desulfobulbaceae bacterium]|jgi:hypothetical protein|nr:hypothetical protein [Desulfobulbaceae bacterium]
MVKKNKWVQSGERNREILFKGSIKAKQLLTSGRKKRSVNHFNEMPEEGIYRIGRSGNIVRYDYLPTSAKDMSIIGFDRVSA